MLDKSPRTIARMFNSIAPRYNFMNDLMTGFSHRRARKIACDYLQFKNEQIVLDLGTGTGDFAFLLCKESKMRVKVIGTDISEKMLRIAKKRARNLDFDDKIHFQVADINDLPFTNNKFDICTIGYALRNVLNPYESLKEIARVTKTKGYLLILEATLPRNKYLRFLSQFYIMKVVPILAKLFSPSPSAYFYLGHSIKRFPTAVQLKKIIKNSGWRKVHFRSILFGTITIFVVIK